MTRCARRVGLAALACIVSLPTTAHAASTCIHTTTLDRPKLVVVEGVSAPPWAASLASSVQRCALLEPELAMALRLRPNAYVRVRYLPDSKSWRVSVRDRASALTLATVELDNATGAVLSRTALPLGQYPSRLTERDAIDAAVEDPNVRRIAGRFGGIDALRAAGRIDDCCWEVDLFAPRRQGRDASQPVMRVDVGDASRQVTGVWTGHQIAWKMARGDRHAFGGSVNERYVWLPLLVLFALVMVDWTRLRSWANTDVLAVLALAISHELFLQGRIEASVPLAVPPLLWLGVRMAWIFARGIPPQRAQTVPRSRLARLTLRRVPTIALLVFCVALAGTRIGLAAYGGNVIDVGYAGVAGARLEQQGRGPWEQMPNDIPHGDTYGPANYLAYLPAVALLDDPDQDLWGTTLPAAKATSIAADLGCALLLALIGVRWISRRGGLLLAAGWLACPWTTWALASSVNDALVALPLLVAFALLPHSFWRGTWLGIAAMVKFAPIVALAPLLHAGSRCRWRQALGVGVGAALAIGAGLAWVTWRLDGSVSHDLRVFAQRTVGFQNERGSPFSIWGLYGWSTAQQLAQIGVSLLLLLACVRPRARDAWQIAAGIAAALIAVQLLVTHWFYLYVPWFIGFVLLVLVAQRERPLLPPERARE